ncbi:MAG: nucleotide exchange factor GrpE [Gemmatimonadetes bacterium]|nr:nucleotide exchange factor GrpE [Gemmatimonadota bacterium]
MTKHDDPLSPHVGDAHDSDFEAGLESAPPAGAGDATAFDDPEASVSTSASADAEIAALAREVGLQKDKYLRAMAEFENFKKRAVRERQEAEHKGMGMLIRGILDSLDDLGRFAHLDPASTDAKTLVDGAAMVEKKILKSLAGHGLELVNPVDAMFDPAFHEALTTFPAASKDEDNMVAQVYQVGYVFNGQLVRPARVVVKQWNPPAE